VLHLRWDTLSPGPRSSTRAVTENRGSVGGLRGTLPLRVAGSFLALFRDAFVELR
jgi:hypothetical protein